MTSPAQICCLCEVFAGRHSMAVVKAWFIVPETPTLARHTLLCSACYEAAKRCGDLVPGAEVEVL